MIKEKETQIIEKEYFIELERIKNTINNYEIGTIINERKVWGNKYIERLANDLKDLVTGYSFRTLKYMSQFANTFTPDEIRQRGVAQISWRTIILIMGKCKMHEEMLFYVELAHKNVWGKDMISNKIAMKAYERSLIAPTTTEYIDKTFLYFSTISIIIFLSSSKLYIFSSPL
jgi:hypothetical protein